MCMFSCWQCHQCAFITMMNTRQRYPHIIQLTKIARVCFRAEEREWKQFPNVYRIENCQHPNDRSPYILTSNNFIDATIYRMWHKNVKLHCNGLETFYFVYAHFFVLFPISLVFSLFPQFYLLLTWNSMNVHNYAFRFEKIHFVISFGSKRKYLHFSDSWKFFISCAVVFFFSM